MTEIKFNKWDFIVIAFVGGFIFGFIIFSLGNFYDSNNDTIICLKQHCFNVELAVTQEQRDHGLMGRTFLNQSNGMLFVYDNEDVRSFWMKNTLIPLDIIWIDANGTVVYIAGNMQPCKTVLCKSVAPDAKAKYVLELNAGVTNKINLTVGDRVCLP